MKLSNTTRRHPRTMAEAFGPYCSQRIEEPRNDSRIVTAIYAVVCFLASAAIGAMVVLGSRA